MTNINNGIITGDQNFSLPPHLNFGRFVLDKLLLYKDTIALINGATAAKITYAQMAQHIASTASSLQDLGLKRGEVVAIFSENRLEYIITAIAAYCVGAVVTFFNSGYGHDEVIHALNISKPKYVFASGDVYNKHHGILRHVFIVGKIILYDPVNTDIPKMTFKELLRKRVDVKSLKTVDYSAERNSPIALILYSSGTTGPAKGAKLSHTNLIVAGLQPPTFKSKLTSLTIAPWSSTMGCICTMRDLVCGRTVVFLSKFDEKVYVKTIEKYKVGILATPPPLLVLLTKSTVVKEYDISSVKIVYCGGAPLNPSVIQQLKTRFPHITHVLQGYGMTEATGALTEDQEYNPREGSVGKIVPGNIIKIVDPETRKTLGVGEPGEVCLKGLVLFQGYIGRPLKEDLDEEGFYKTGDIAYYDKEGYFYIVDRLKELIKYKAWQVAPSELESLLLQHKAVKDAAVIGAPDAEAGELPTAFVVRQPNANVTEKEIIDYVSSKVSPWKKIRGGVIFRNEIPKTPSGKILRRKLRDSLPKIPTSKL